MPITLRRAARIPRAAGAGEGIIRRIGPRWPHALRRRSAACPAPDGPADRASPAGHGHRRPPRGHRTTSMHIRDPGHAVSESSQGTTLAQSRMRDPRCFCEAASYRGMGQPPVSGIATEALWGIARARSITVRTNPIGPVRGQGGGSSPVRFPDSRGGPSTTSRLDCSGTDRSTG